MIRLGVAIQETFGFFNEIFNEFQKRYTVSVFTHRSWQLPVFHSRINRLLYDHDLKKFMSENEVVFFEWASKLLADATNLPKTSRIIVRLHRYEMYRWVNSIDWDKVDRIILVSHAKKEEFIARFPSQADKIVVSGPSTSLERFTPKPRTFKGDIGILCHLTPRKRVYDLILAFYELLELNKGFHLHIAGGMDPAYEDYFHALHNLVADLGIQEKVTFYGNVQDPWNWYHNIDIFVSNSYSEGLQVAPMEAMASGCFCLAHRWRGADELLPEDYLYHTAAELVEKISRYSMMTDLDKNGQKRYMRTIAEEKFDIKQTVNQVVQLIDDIAIND